MKRINPIMAILLLSIAHLVACGGPPPPRPPADGNNAVQAQTIAETTGAVTIRGEVWADNWFAFYLGGKLILEDSASITTERSFNAESFNFNADYPLQLNFVVKDFKENDTGLEYIGQGNQQMGDGGFIAQFTDTATGQTIAATDDNWQCTVIHEAPLDKGCENASNPVAGEGLCGFSALDEPAGWKSADFNADSWPNAVTYAAVQVSPKDGYDQISWDSSAQLIWTSDLETDNTILCRLRVDQP